MKIENRNAGMVQPVQRFIGDSTEVKPTGLVDTGNGKYPVDTGAVFYEKNTEVEYIFDGDEWQIKGVERPILLTDTAVTITGKFTSIIVRADGTEFTTLTSNITKNGTVAPLVAADLTGLEKNDILYGVFTTVKLKSGSIWLMP